MENAYFLNYKQTDRHSAVIYNKDISSLTSKNKKKKRKKGSSYKVKATYKGHFENKYNYFARYDLPDPGNPLIRINHKSLLYLLLVD